LLPKGKRKTRINPSLFREMWRTAASLELLPTQTKAQMGDAVMDLLKTGQMVEAAVWCLSRLGARKLFNAPINLVVAPAVVNRWIESMLRLPRTPSVLEALVRVGQQTGDTARDLSPVVLDSIRRALESSPQAASLLRELAGETDAAASSRTFGEELPAGLVLVEAPAV